MAVRIVGLKKLPRSGLVQHPIYAAVLTNLGLQEGFLGCGFSRQPCTS
ncbi:hypothetical protein [Paenibacillus macquariensis]|nr:hypothetical protein [Paenibacillus macquariensis]MEC0093852.1 hypothetical protein [Paenibacillus macquariensis]